MLALGFLVALQARDGRESDIEACLRSAKALVEDEPGTLLWFAFRCGSGANGIFDVFDSDSDRTIHLHGEVRNALDTHGAELFSTAPVITPVDLIASKWADPRPR